MSLFLYYIMPFLVKYLVMWFHLKQNVFDALAPTLLLNLNCYFVTDNFFVTDPFSVAITTLYKPEA